jgi:DNA-3-methyladenine glycosylase II
MNPSTTSTTGTTRTPTATTRRRIEIGGPFSLAQSAGFLGGGMAHISPGASPHPDHLHLAFVPDGQSAGAVGACIRQPSADRVDIEVSGAVTDLDRVVAQVARILSLDVDGRGYEAIGEADPVVGRRQAMRPGFRPVNFASPFEAASHFLISQRISMRQAANIKTRMAEEHGERVEVCTQVKRAFPGPAKVAALTEVGGVSERKIGYLHALADAALSTDLLDGAAIRSKPAGEAVEGLETLPGVGPFTSFGVVIRGAGAPDVLALHEPRVRRATEELYGLDAPLTDERFIGLAESWRPYRSWVTVLLRSTAD